MSSRGPDKSKNNNHTNTKTNTSQNKSNRSNNKNIKNTDNKNKGNKGHKMNKKKGVNNLSFTVFIDTVVGAFAGFSLAWFITPLDAAVMQNMSGTTSMSASLKEAVKTIVTRPWEYMARPEYKFVSVTYGATYLTKNWTDTYCKRTHQTPEREAFLKFWLVFAVNGGLSVGWKDPGLANIFSPHSFDRKQPLPTLASWILRDTVHIIGAAVLPDYIEERYKLTHEQWTVVQLTFPLLVQTLTTPCHLLGLDFYNYEVSPWRDRLGRVAQTYVPTCGVRMVRMFAPWSIGLLINRDLKEYLTGQPVHPMDD